MKRRRRYIRVVALISVIVVAGFLGAGMLLVGQSSVSFPFPEASLEASDLVATITRIRNSERLNGCGLR